MPYCQAGKYDAGEDAYQTAALIKEQAEPPAASINPEMTAVQKYQAIISCDIPTKAQIGGQGIEHQQKEAEGGKLFR